MRSQWLQVGVKYATLFLALCVPASAKVLFVRPAGGGDGSSWTTALPSVQGGLDAALSGDEVWVAEGTYKEQITLKSGVALYGGFVGHETERSQRNWTENPTILDGETVRSIVAAGPDVTEQATVDGFTIQNGMAAHWTTDSFGQPVYYGGGFYCANANVRVAYCIVQGNVAPGGDGGGMALFGGDYTIVDSEFVNNAAQPPISPRSAGGAGDAVYADRLSSQDTLNMTFNGNFVHANGTPAANGGTVAVFILNSASAEVSGNVFQQNSGQLNVQGDNVSVTHNTVEDNANSGVSAYAGNELHVADNVISGNTWQGLSASGDTAVVERNVIIGNGSAERPYGGLVCFSGGHSLTVRDNLIAANTGLGIHFPNPSGGTPTWTNRVVNNTIVGNTSNDYGAGITIFRGGNGDIIANNIVAYNQSSGFGASGIYADKNPPTFRNNDVFGNATANYAGVPDPTGTNGNSSADPLFVDRSAGNYRLLPGSPAIDAGNDSLTQATETDLDGNARRMGLRVDMGAYESGVPNPDGLALAVRALRVAAGLDAAPADWQTLNTQDTGASAGLVDLLDAAVLIRRSLGVH